MITYGSLFAGIGGFDLGFERAGMQCLWQVEIDTAARSVLSRHWPDVPKFTDVRDVGAYNLPAVDVICGGFPCQDLSVAGNRKGLKGERSSLYWEVIRIVREMREATDGQYPAIVVLENVPGLLSSGVTTANPGGDFALVLKGLSDLGAAVAYRIFDAQFFGVAQRRRRVFIVASFAELDIGERCVSEILALNESLHGHPTPSRAAGQDVAGTPGGSSQSGGFRTTDLDNDGAFIPLVARSERTSNQRIDAESETLLPIAQSNRGSVGHVTETIRAGSHGALPLAFTSKDYGGDAGALSPTLRSLNFDKSHMNGGGQVAVATFDERNITGKTNRTRREYGLPANTLHADALSVITPMAVRRLTPTECERLQGFPDGWTAGQADSNRYRQLGNAVAVPCAGWIAKRLVEVAL